jgi:hypothetical protein
MTGLVGALVACGNGATSPRSDAGGSATSVVTTPSSTARPSGPSSGSSVAGPSVQNLTLTPAIRTALTAAYVTLNHLSRYDVVGMVPGRTFYARDAATGLHWAVAEFAFAGPTVAEQDGGSIAIFRQLPNGAWGDVASAALAAYGNAAVPDCRTHVPSPVMSAWGWDTAIPTCGAPATADSYPPLPISNLPPAPCPPNYVSYGNPGTASRLCVPITYMPREGYRCPPGSHLTMGPGLCVSDTVNDTIVAPIRNP